MDSVSFPESPLPRPQPLNSKGCLIPDAGTQGCKLFPGRAACPETTGGWCARLQKGRDLRPPDALCTRQLMCYLYRQEHEIQPLERKLTPVSFSNLHAFISSSEHKKDILKYAGNKTILETTEFMIMI